MMLRQVLRRAGLASAMTVAFASLSAAQTSSADWAGTWKLKSGLCPDGLPVEVAEKPGTLTVTTKYRSGNAASQEWPVKADGSGSIDFKSRDFGSLRIEVPAGRGPRQILVSQKEGQNGREPCSWVIGR